ncbi:MAG: PilZ domain-containing protein [Kiritimatiellia bacterium]
MSGSSEDRMNDRIAKAGKVAVCWRRGLFKKKLVGNVVDISASGLQINAPEPVPVGKTVKLDIKLAASGMETEDFRLKGRISRCAPGAAPRSHFIGIMLTSNRGDRGTWNETIFAQLRARNEY